MDPASADSNDRISSRSSNGAETNPALQATAVVTTLLATLFAAWYLVSSRRRRAANLAKSVVLVGAPDAGKTALLARLVHDAADAASKADPTVLAPAEWTLPPTVTSLAPAHVPALQLTRDVTVAVTACAGHDRLAATTAAELARAGVAVLVVDSRALATAAGRRAAADRLVAVLDAVDGWQRPVRVVIATTHADCTDALPPTKVLALLDAEVHRVRSVAQTSVGAMDDSTVRARRVANLASAAKGDVDRVSLADDLRLAVVAVSAVTGSGVHELRKRIAEGVLDVRR
ncbi:hypothetical protein AMAG_00456 [Allomyces macrogynus ATCC 38327]|uniref:Signal recognition particle receptor subunit beta n=1 Tax=Allomyces macrogynus (strain ATCC 38327) TaxID=578462 RepID=A0A0L0RWK2_ALLM3|nr:hypothetical protein AMAG_00456 [Allomyces macrogynus ATCC 38327]|eukprot:KNE54485.1 hypothetical protein AMAG_00456 [Allomyces macrogynus ATCC 38327]